MLGLFLSLAAWAVALAQPARPAEHILGPGDVIRISVYQNPDLSLETRISELGQITFPLVGVVSVGGKSITSAQEAIAKQLRDGNFVLKPQVSVMVVQVRSTQISILGQVARPGRYPVETANAKLSEMIAAAGGILPGGADEVTLVGSRDGKPVKLTIDLPAILQAGRQELDVVVANGDIVYVDRAPIVYIYGEVQKPGSVRLERGMTLMQALAQGGGLTQRGTERGIRVYRRTPKGDVTLLELKMNEGLQANDVIYVRESVF
ncbi:MAG: polysaccharide export protein EpsE [Rhizobacter sp.]|nr:polysaccharide export protein EpsE [Rhizobacter sp.]